MKKVHLIAGITVGLSVILAGYLSWLLLLSPVNKKIEVQEQNLATLEAKLKDAETKKKQHEKFRAEAENVNRNLVFVKSRIDSSFGENDVYREFSGLVNAFRVTDPIIKPLKPGKEEGLAEYMVEVTFKANYHQLGELINGAISRRRVIVPKELKLESMGSEGNTESLLATLGFGIYAEPAAKAAAKK